MAVVPLLQFGMGAVIDTFCGSWGREQPSWGPEELEF
jgi:hypothetical protein